MDQLRLKNKQTKLTKIERERERETEWDKKSQNDQYQEWIRLDLITNKQG